MKKKEKIIDLLTKISDKLCKSDMKNFIRDDANATQLINYEEANKIGYAVFFKNELSHIII